MKTVENDIGLKINGFDIKWYEKEGIIWNPSNRYSVWNHTNSTRIMICFDIFKELSFVNNIISKKIYYGNRYVKNVNKILNQLEYEEIISENIDNTIS